MNITLKRIWVIVDIVCAGVCAINAVRCYKKLKRLENVEENEG